MYNITVIIDATSVLLASLGLLMLACVVICNRWCVITYACNNAMCEYTDLASI